MMLYHKIHNLQERARNVFLWVDNKLHLSPNPGYDRRVSMSTSFRRVTSPGAQVCLVFYLSFCLFAWVHLHTAGIRCLAVHLKLVKMDTGQNDGGYVLKIQTKPLQNKLVKIEVQ